MRANLRFQALQSASSYRVIRVKLRCNLCEVTMQTDMDYTDWG